MGEDSLYPRVGAEEAHDGRQSGPDTLPFVVQEMSEDDLDDVVCIEVASFSNPWRRRDFEYALTKRDGHCLVALAEGRVVGYSIGFFVLGEYHLADFVVHPEFRNRGLGRRFLHAVLEMLESREVNHVTLEVRMSNAPALALYEKSGFQTVAIRRGYYSRPREDAFVMLKALRGSFSDWVDSSLIPPFSGR